MSKCQHFSIPQQGWGCPTALHFSCSGTGCWAEPTGTSPGKEVSSCLHL